MAVETKMFICTTQYFDEPLIYAKTVVMVDLCKIGTGFKNRLNDISENKGKKTHFLYAVNGRTRITVDQYNQALEVFKPMAFLKMLREQMALDKTEDEWIYRRFKIAEAAIASAYRRFKGEDLRILLYDY